APAASSLEIGTYTANIAFTDVGTGRSTTRLVTLIVESPSSSQLLTAAPAAPAPAAAPAAAPTTQAAVAQAAAAPVSTITIGETAITSVSDCCNANLLIAQQASLSQLATIQSMSFYVTTAAGKLRLGLYDATGPGGGPGSKLAETAEITPVAGWNTANV